jgi:hypothetical protein
MRLHYFPKSGALWDGCCDPLLKHITNIYLRRWPYRGVTNEAIAVEFNTYGAGSHLKAGHDSLWGVS